MSKQKGNFFQRLINGIGTGINKTFFRIFNGFIPTFSTYSEKITDNDAALACINTIATHAAKFVPEHYKADQKIDGDINYLLSIQPNPIMTPYDFMYRSVALLYCHNNLFIYIDKDKNGMITGFYPINYTTGEFVRDADNNLYLSFYLMNGKLYYLPYDDLIHLRRFYNDDDLFGSSNIVLSSALQNQMTAEEGIGIAIKTSNALRGVYKINANLKKEDIEDRRTEFVDAFIKDNKDGIAVVDSKGEFKEINLKPITLDKEQLEHVNQRVLNYFNLNTSILSSDYSSSQWNAFYESVLEPLSIYFSQSFKIKIFSKKALKEGHTINFSVNRVKYSSPDEKIKMVKELAPLGVLTVDTALSILDLPKVGGEEGARRLQSLNYINAAIADKYQMSKFGLKGDDENGQN